MAKVRREDLVRLHAEDAERIPALLAKVDEVAELPGLGDALNHLAKALHEHFEEEEGPDGLFEQLRADNPGNDPQLKELTDQHAGILSKLAAVRGALGETANVADVARDAKSLTSDVRVHVEQEHKVIYDTYMNDIGTGD